MLVQEAVQPKITTELPVHHVPFDVNWKHLKGLHLVDPDFSVLESIDLLLGADLFVNIIRHGWRVGPPGTPSAMQNAFGWMVARNINGEQLSM